MTAWPVLLVSLVLIVGGVAILASLGVILCRHQHGRRQDRQAA